MPVLLEAWKALRRQPVALLGYLAAAMLVVGPIYFSDAWVAGAYPKEALPGWLPLLSTAQDVLLLLGVSAAQAVFFAMLGREMDRPLWRCLGHRDALSRFFVVWLLANGIIVLLIRLQVRAAVANLPELMVFLELLNFFATILLPMVAASVMYQGRLVWSQLGEAFAPFLQFPGLVFPVIFVHLTAYLTHAVLGGLMAGGGLSPLAQTLLILPVAFLDILAFAAMWRVCMHQRDHGHRPDADPYDF